MIAVESQWFARVDELVYVYSFHSVLREPSSSDRSSINIVTPVGVPR